MLEADAEKNVALVCGGGASSTHAARAGERVDLQLEDPRRGALRRSRGGEEERLFRRPRRLLLRLLQPTGPTEPNQCFSKVVDTFFGGRRLQNEVSGWRFGGSRGHERRRPREVLDDLNEVTGNLVERRRRSILKQREAAEAPVRCA